LWYEINDLPELILDHKQIVDRALDILRLNVHNKTIGKNLLMDTFTMGDLQKLYETILNEELHRTGFHRKMLQSGLLKRLGKKKTGEAHRSPYLYKFKPDEPKLSI
jgi:8-oxo-dGTP diphosphatase